MGGRIHVRGNEGTNTMKPSFSHTLARLKGLRRHGITLVRPTREWALGLILGVVLFVAGCIHAALMFGNASAGGIDEGAAPKAEDTLPYRESEVERTLELYEARAAQFERLRGVVPPPAASVSEGEMTEDGDESDAPAREPIDAIPVAQ
jgi:hypothetical protein